MSKINFMAPWEKLWGGLIRSLNCPKKSSMSQQWGFWNAKKRPTAFLRFWWTKQWKSGKKSSARWKSQRTNNWTWKQFWRSTKKRTNLTYRQDAIVSKRLALGIQRPSMKNPQNSPKKSKKSSKSLVLSVQKRNKSLRRASQWNSFIFLWGEPSRIL